MCNNTEKNLSYKFQQLLKQISTFKNNLNFFQLSTQTFFNLITKIKYLLSY